jgi:hypothetical protein
MTDKPHQEREKKMTIFTEHPHAQGVTYFEHWSFAIGIAWRLLRSVLAFSLHALLPFITIARQFDLRPPTATTHPSRHGRQRLPAITTRLLLPDTGRSTKE